MPQATRVLEALEIAVLWGGIPEFLAGGETLPLYISSWSLLTITAEQARIMFQVRLEMATIEALERWVERVERAEERLATAIRRAKGSAARAMWPQFAELTRTCQATKDSIQARRAAVINRVETTPFLQAICAPPTIPAPPSRQR